MEAKAGDSNLLASTGQDRRIDLADLGGFTSRSRAPTEDKGWVAKQITGIDRPTVPFLRHVGDWLQDRAWVFDTVGTASIDRLLEVFRYGSRRYGIIEDEKPDASLELIKDRNGKAGHRKIYLCFCREAQQFTPDNNRRGRSYIEFSTQKEAA